MKKHIKSYLSFSKKELNGILVLFMLCILILLVPFCYRYFDEPETYDISRFQQEIAVFKASAIARKKSYPALKNKIEESSLKPDYFSFDPNNATSAEWHRLGLSSKQISVLKNYLSKGGKFYKKEDLKKIYSISEDQYRNLEPYIQIDSSTTFKSKKGKIPDFNNQVKNQDKNTLVVELNAADSAMFDQLRGIGPAFASRIVRYRNRLGGFFSKTQLMEVYGMDSLRYSQIVNQTSLNASGLKKLKINTATFEELRNHPYLTFKQINAIIQYRKQHGSYSSADDLKRVLILDEEIIRKIGPYLSFDP